MRFESFIGRRHLLGSGRRLRVRLSAFIAIASVAVGVGALVVVIAVIDGMDALFHRKYMDLVAHMEVVPLSGEEGTLLSDPAAVEAALAGDSRVEAFAPLVQSEAFLLPEQELFGQRSPVEILGVDPERTGDVAAFVNRTSEGSGEPGPNEIVLGWVLANQVLGAHPGDTIWANTRFMFTANLPHFRWVELKVVGTFMTGIPDLDAGTAYVNLETARRIFLLPDNAVNAYQVRVDDPYRARADAEALAAAHPSLDVRFRPWNESNPEFFHALRLEKIGTLVMLFMIILVASFNIVGTLVMIVTERTREIGILKAMGASDASVRAIFLRSGLTIGLLGTGIGLGGGLTLCWLIGSVIPLQLPAALYDLEHLPVLVHWPTVSLIAVASLAICLLASVLPARTAAHLDPVVALRHD